MEFITRRYYRLRNWWLYSRHPAFVQISSFGPQRKACVSLNSPRGMTTIWAADSWSDANNAQAGIVGNTIAHIAGVKMYDTRKQADR